MTIFGKSWDLHVTEVLGASLAQNLDMIAESVAWVSERGREVVYDAEHYFDGYKADREYALNTLRAAREAGARDIVLCDTNGGTLTGELVRIFEDTRDTLAADPDAPAVTWGIHTHNDAELAVANTMAAVAAGARHVQATINGYGERCGNANMVSVMANLALKTELQLAPVGGGEISHLTSLSRSVAEIANVTPLDYQPFVGRSAFAHKGGVHGAAVAKVEHSYQHVDPVLIGNESRLVVSELGGRANTRIRAEQLGHNLEGVVDARELSVIIKELENQGLAFEGAEASFELLIRRRTERLRAALRDPRLHHALGAAHGPGVPGRGHRQGAGRWRGAAHRGRRQRPRQRARRGHAQGAGRLLPAAGVDAPGRLQGAHPRRRGRDRGPHPRHHRLPGRRLEWSTMGSDTNIISASAAALADSFEYAIWKQRGTTRTARSGHGSERLEAGPDACVRRTLGSRHDQPTSPLRVAFAGAPGSFAEDAVLAAYPGAEAVPVPMFGDVVVGRRGRARWRPAWCPSRTSSAAGVREVYDLLLDTEAVVVGEVIVPVRLCLAALPGERLESIERVYSHIQALTQAEPFLRSHDWTLLAATNTAGAGRTISERGERGSAAVLSPRAAAIHGLEVLAEDIQAERRNRTRFLVLALPGADGPAAPGHGRARRQPPQRHGLLGAQRAGHAGARARRHRRPPHQHDQAGITTQSRGQLGVRLLGRHRLRCLRRGRARPGLPRGPALGLRVGARDGLLPALRGAGHLGRRLRHRVRRAQACTTVP